MTMSDLQAVGLVLQINGALGSYSFSILNTGTLRPVVNSVR